MCVLSLISRRNIEIPTRINFNSPKKSLHHCCHNGLFLFLFNEIFMVFWRFITWFVILIVVLVWWSWIKRSSIKFEGRKISYLIMKIKIEVSILLVLLQVKIFKKYKSWYPKACRLFWAALWLAVELLKELKTITGLWVFRNCVS